MTREERIARARELRTRGLLFREIGAQVGVSGGTVAKWLDPDAARRYQTRDNARRGAARHYRPCPQCGSRMCWKATRCASCRREEESRRTEASRWRLVNLWSMGLSAKEIGRRMGYSARSVHADVSRLRALGYPLEVRNPGSQRYMLAHLDQVAAARAAKDRVAA